MGRDHLGVSCPFFWTCDSFWLGGYCCSNLEGLLRSPSKVPQWQVKRNSIHTRHPTRTFLCPIPMFLKSSLSTIYCILYWERLWLQFKLLIVDLCWHANSSLKQWKSDNPWHPDLYTLTSLTFCCYITDTLLLAFALRVGTGPLSWGVESSNMDVIPMDTRVRKPSPGQQWQRL